MQDKGLVITFYGYLTELGANLAGSGHLALSQMLRDPNIDAIVSPYKYDQMYRQPSGPMIPMGPFDSPRLFGKLWISEDDTRTSLAFSSVGGPKSCYTRACDHQMMRRNLLTSVLHGSGLYQL